MSRTVNPYYRAYSVRVLANDNAGKPSGKRPFARRKETPFTRPAAKYDNLSWEEQMARVEALPEPTTKNRKP